MLETCLAVATTVLLAQNGDFEVQTIPITIMDFEDSIQFVRESNAEFAPSIDPDTGAMVVKKTYDCIYVPGN